MNGLNLMHIAKALVLKICTFHNGIDVTVNSEFPRLYSEGSREPELGGPCTVQDSFEPLGVFVKFT
jgi:hypothetical protein